MKKEKTKMSRRKKVVIAVIAAVVAVAVVGGGIFYCTFFPNPLAKKISVSDISTGTMSVTSESNVFASIQSPHIHNVFLSVSETHPQTPRK